MNVVNVATLCFCVVMMMYVCMTIVGHVSAKRSDSWRQDVTSARWSCYLSLTVMRMPSQRGLLNKLPRYQQCPFITRSIHLALVLTHVNACIRRLM